MATILVTGATGTLAREVVAQLSNRGQKVRAFVRDPKADFPAGVDKFAGDLLAGNGLAEAVGGA